MTNITANTMSIPQETYQQSLQQEIRTARAAALIKVRDAKIAVRLANHEVEAVKIRCTHPCAIEHKRGDYRGEKWTESRCEDCGLVYMGSLENLRLAL